MPGASERVSVGRRQQMRVIQQMRDRSAAIFEEYEASHDDEWGDEGEHVPSVDTWRHDPRTWRPAENQAALGELRARVREGVSNNRARANNYYWNSGNIGLDWNLRDYRNQPTGPANHSQSERSTHLKIHD